QAIERLAATAERVRSTSTGPAAPGTSRRWAAGSPAPEVRVPDVPAATDLDDDGYADVVRRLQNHIVAGDIFQIVPSRGFCLPCPEPLAAYARLRATNPSPYMFYVRGDERTLFGTSPETCVKVYAPVGPSGRGLR